MSVVILDQGDVELGLSNGLLICRYADKGCQVLPWAGVEQVFVGKGVRLSSDVLLALSEHKVSLVVAGHKPSQLACLTPLTAPCSDMKLRQYQVFSDEARVARWRIQLVKAKATNQAKVLKQLGLPLPKPWHKWLAELALAPNLMLAEAHLAHAYWQQWALLFADWGFSKRVRRPPTDPVNACLSLAATLEDSLYCHALLGQGLDIGLGLHHATGYRRYSLIYDVKELARADVEAWVARLFLSGQLNEAHFVQQTGGACCLSAAGKPVFYRAWFVFAASHRKKVARLARFVAQMITKGAQQDDRKAIVDYQL